MTPMRKPLVAGNWKMNKTIAEARTFAGSIARGLADLQGAAEKVDIVLGPPYLSLPAVAEAAAGSPIGVAGQDCSAEAGGAFTGEVSVPMLKDAGATHVIVGHSERRELLSEGDTQVAAKAAAASSGGLVPIVCIGEPITTREAGATLDRIGFQLEYSVFSVFKNPPGELVVAYEPVWAIGTGKTATPAQAQEVHAYIRKRLGENFGVDWAGNSRILYGGSMKPGNAAELLAQPDIDGGLIGGASLVEADFLEIVRIAAGG
jgi:triosephosphate isomerase